MRHHAIEIITLLAAAAVVLAALKWAFLPFLPYRRLPRNRVRYLRTRLHLRLHPGRGSRHGPWSCGGGGAGSPRSAAPAGPAGR